MDTKDIKNKMSQQRANDIVSNLGVEKPVFEIREGEVQPVFIMAGDCEVAGVALNFMVGISYYIKEQRYEAKARHRLPSGRKDTFLLTPKVPLTYEQMKENARKMFSNIENAPAWGGWLKEPQELEIHIGASVDEILKAMDKSDMFDIGVVHKN